MLYSTTKILLIDDHPLLITSVSEMLSGIFPGANIKTANSLQEVVRLEIGEDFDLVVSDLCLGDATPEEVTSVLSSRFIRSKVAYFSGLEESDPIAKNIRSKGNLFINKGAGYLEAAKALRGYVQPKESFDFEASNEYRSNIQVPGNKPLTKIQAQVMDGIIEGFSIKEIARNLQRSPDTVKAHVREAYIRLGAENRATAVSAYVRAKKVSQQLHV